MATSDVMGRPEVSFTASGLSNWIKRHSLVAYFVVAFAGTWIFFAPILLSQKGLGLLVLPDAAAFVFFFLATYTGPFLSAFVVTGVIEGKAGVRQLLRRIVQWRVGVQWYLLVLIGYPVIFLLGLTVTLGMEPLNGLIHKWPLIFTVYLSAIPIGLLLPSLGEETGWRGFALPRLQHQYGPLLGSLILGTLHGLWHLPAYFIPGAILPGAFDLTVFVANTLAIVASTVIWTWLFNNANGSILFAMFIHSTSNANSGLLPKLLTTRTNDPWFGFKVLALGALAIIAFTRGRLSYKPNGEAEPAQATTQAAD
jgi:membrane protease YdiL (CAAX protease family)